MMDNMRHREREKIKIYYNKKVIWNKLKGIIKKIDILNVKINFYEHY